MIQVASVRLQRVINVHPISLFSFIPTSSHNCEHYCTNTMYIPNLQGLLTAGLAITGGLMKRELSNIPSDLADHDPLATPFFFTSRSLPITASR